MTAADQLATICETGYTCNCTPDLAAASSGIVVANLCIATAAIKTGAATVSAANIYYTDTGNVCANGTVYEDFVATEYCDTTGKVTTVFSKFAVLNAADSEYAPLGIVPNKKKTICARKAAACLSATVTDTISIAGNSALYVVDAMQVCAPGDFCNCNVSTSVSKAAKDVITSLCVKQEAIMQPGTMQTATRNLCVKTDNILEQCTAALPYCPIGGGACAADYVAPTTTITSIERTAWASLETNKFTVAQVTKLKTFADDAAIATLPGHTHASHTHGSSPASPSHHHPFAAVSMAALLSA